MKKDDVKVGGTYTMKVGAEVVSVRITDEKWKGDALDGWVGVNLKTNRSVRIKTAQKLRAEVGDGSAQDATGDAPAPGTPDAPAGDPAPQTPTSGTGGGKGGKRGGRMSASAARAEGAQRADQARDAAVAAGSEPNAPPANKKQAKTPKEPKPKKISALDAAAQVLAAAGKAMNAKEMIAAMAEQNLWSSPGGKTPEATLYAAIIREISAKGADARFRKTERGMFEAAGKGA